MKQEFKKIHDGFEKIYSRFESIDNRLEGIDGKFEKIDSRFEKIDTRFNQMDNRFDQLVNYLQVNMMHRADFDDMKNRIKELNENTNNMLQSSDGVAKQLLDMNIELKTIRFDVSGLKDWATKVSPKVAVKFSR